MGFEVIGDVTMKVFVTGATGYLGSHIARTFRQAGYRVFGLTRNEKKADLLARQEIIPVIGNMQEPGSFFAHAIDSDILIHAAVDYENDSADLDKMTVQSLIASAKSSNRTKVLIYTSGVWVHGDTGSQPANERTPVNPIRVVKWRPTIEDLVRQSTDVNGIVIRPGCVYGERGGLTALWFESATTSDDFTVIGDGTNHWAMVHASDLAHAYLLTAESGLRNEIFNITDGAHSTVKEMTSTVADIAGYRNAIHYLPLDEARKTMGDFADALAIDQQIDISKARKMLNWKPRHTSFCHDVDLYYAAWKAMVSYQQAETASIT
jgi:nucleoside-diphosphate-sugar epimerase